MTRRLILALNRETHGLIWCLARLGWTGGFGPVAFLSLAISAKHNLKHFNHGN
jgi:hypothetical protein